MNVARYRSALTGIPHLFIQGWECTSCRYSRWCNLNLMQQILYLERAISASGALNFSLAGLQLVAQLRQIKIGLSALWARNASLHLQILKGRFC